MPEELTVVRKDTVSSLNQLLSEIFDWLNTDAKYAHPNSKLKALRDRTGSCRLMLWHDMDNHKGAVVAPIPTQDTQGNQITGE